MNDRQLKPTSWLDAGRSRLAQSGKLLFGLGMTATLPPPISAARKDKRADEEADARKDERRDARSEDSAREAKSQASNGASSENSRSSDEGANDTNDSDNNRSEKQERRDERSSKDDSTDNDDSANAEQRSVTRKQQAAADDSGADSGRVERRSEEFAQNRNRDDEPNVDDTPDDVAPPPTVPSNPNIPVATAPDPTDADLFIEANPDVVASVSTSGGFAFARSGNVIAVTGPDGAQIIQSDDPENVVTPSPSPDTPPDDGGNNDIDFSS